MKRYPYQMETLTYKTMQVGRLMTLGQFPVIANDSIELMLPTIFRLSPLRRNLSVDARVDLFAFFVPHRHIYGEDWVNFLMQGVDENVTLGSAVINAGTHALGYRFEDNTPRALHVLAGYNRIWNRYFRYPTDNSDRGTFGEDYFYGEVPDTAQLDYQEGSGDNAADARSYGRHICLLKDALSTGIYARTDASDRDVNVSGGTFDVVDLEKAKSRYKSELTRDYEVAADRYTDSMSNVFGAAPVNTDADQRPTLLAHQAQWLSGYDVNGTGDASLGQYAGRSEGQYMFGFPKRYFKEHGTIWVLASIRYPTFRGDETHYLTRPNLSYVEQSGDPLMVAAQPPGQLDLAHFFPGVASTLIPGEHFPYGQWYRTLPPGDTHPDYDAVQGFPFGNSWPRGLSLRWFSGRHYVPSGLYDRIFQTTQLAHCQVSAKFNYNVMRITPPAGWSIQAGAK